jgi:hypothetical protein
MFSRTATGLIEGMPTGRAISGPAAVTKLGFTEFPVAFAAAVAGTLLIAAGLFARAAPVGFEADAVPETDFVSGLLMDLASAEPVTVVLAGTAGFGAGAESPAGLPPATTGAATIPALEAEPAIALGATGVGLATELVPDVLGLDTADGGEADAGVGRSPGFAAVVGFAPIEGDAGPEPKADLTAGATGFKSGFGAAAGGFGF